MSANSAQHEEAFEARLKELQEQAMKVLESTSEDEKNLMRTLVENWSFKVLYLGYVPITVRWTTG